ncbi:MAG: LysR family transcriptional regulator [Coriobacteriales bacterium]|nr:LysR family transcriptional regulator [Coriobacteriales bacterium]
MDIESLRSFLAVVSTGSFTKAAQEMYVTQPTLSRRVHDLEVELNAQLLIREARSVKLTNEGMALRQAAVSIIQDFDSLHLVVKQASAASDSQSRLSGAITVGHQAYVNQSYLMRFIKYFQKRYPNVEVYVRTEPPQVLEKLESSGVIDVSFMLKPNIEAIKIPGEIVLKRDCLQLLVPISHPFAERSAVDIMDIKDQEFILGERRLDPVLSDYLVSRCIENGFSLKASRYVSTLQDEATLVSVGKGLSFTSSMINYGDPLTSLDLCTVDIKGVDLSVNYVVHARENLPQSLRDALLDALVSFKQTKMKH